MNDPNLIPMDAIAKHAFLAFFGGLAHAINAHRKGKSKGVVDFLFLTALSSFSGIIFALVAMHLFDSEYITLAAAGSGGYLGVEGLTLLATKIQEVISKPLNK